MTSVMRPNVIIWRLSDSTFRRYHEILDQIQLVNNETSDDHWALVEDIRTLPGFPKEYNGDVHELHLEMIEKPTSLIIAN